MNDADRVAAIERRHELALLDQLLEERRRPVPPPPPRPATYDDPNLRPLLVEVMQLIAEAVHIEYKRWGRSTQNIVDIGTVVHGCSTPTSEEILSPSTRSAQAIRRPMNDMSTRHRDRSMSA